MRPVFALLLLIVLSTGLLSLGPFVYRLHPDGELDNEQHAEAALERTQWDFDKVLSGPKLCAKFPIKNTGDRRLIVRRRTSSCECIAGDHDTMILQPGEATEITATLDTRRLEGDYQMELPYTTSAPNLPKFTLVVRATVRRLDLAVAH